VTYLNQGRRLNYGAGAFRLTQIYDEDLGFVRREKRLGVLGLASYPFDKFTRVEATVFARHASNHLLRNGTFQTVDLVSNFVGLVHDNARWTILGPSSGTRANLSAGFTRDLTAGQGDFVTLSADVRGYRLLSPWLVTATRVQSQTSIGRDAQRFYIGGYRGVRGYDRRRSARFGLNQLAGTKSFLAQQEFRFPVLRGLTFAVPTTWVFPTISAAAFADAGWVWEEDWSDHRGSVGVGWFVGGGYFPALRWNYVWPTTDWRHYSSGPRTQFVLDYNF
jgi:outer membrane protein assembly factor BamA